MATQNPVVYGDTYGDVARNELAGQSAEDAYYFNTLANQARRRDAAFQEARFASDANYRRWLAQQDQAYRDRALAQSGNQFSQNLDYEKTRNLGDNDYRNRALAQSGNQFGQNLAFEKTRNLTDNDYRNRALAQSGSQFGQNLELQRTGQSLDNAYRYGALNANLSESAANRAARADEQASANDLGWAHLNASNQNAADNLDYSNRALAQTGAYQNRTLDQAQTNSDLQWQRSLDAEKRNDAKVLSGQNDALYKEAFNNIANGVIRTPEQLDSWEGGRLSSDQYNNLHSLLGEASRRTGLSFEQSQHKADALNSELNMRLSPLQSGYDKAQKDLQNALPETHWYNPSTWGHMTTADASNALPLLRYNQEKEKFLEATGKSKAFGDIIFDPVTGHFVPSNPAPEGYVPTVPVNPVAPSQGNSLAGNTVTQNAPTAFVPVPGTNYLMDPDTRSTMIAQMSQFTNPFDREAVMNKFLQSAVDSGKARLAEAASSPADYSSGLGGLGYMDAIY